MVESSSATSPFVGDGDGGLDLMKGSLDTFASQSESWLSWKSSNGGKRKNRKKIQAEGDRETSP